MAVAKLVVEANANLTNLYRELDKGTAAVQRFASGVKSAGTAMSVGLTLPLVGLGVAVGSAAADMDSLKRGLTAVAGSSRGAEEQLKRLEDVAKLPGLGFREAIQGSIRLQAAGLNVNLAERALRSFGNAIALTGGGKQQLDTITTQLGQLAAKGRVLGSDLRPIIEAAPAVGNALRQAFGTVDPEQIQKLGLSTEQFLTRLTNQLDTLPKVTGGAKNSFENFTDSLFRAKVAIGEQLLPVIVPLVEGLTRMLEGARSLNPETVRWAIAIGSVVAVAGPLLFVIGQLTAAVTALTAAIGLAGLAGTIATGGILLLLGALSALFVKNKLDALAAAGAADRYRASLIGLSETQLLSHLTAEQLRLAELHGNELALLATDKAFETVRPVRIASARTGIASTSRSPAVQRETEDMRRLGQEANATGARIAELKKALDLLHGTTSPTPPPTPPGGRDKLAGLIDSLTDRLRELAVLQKFNVPSIDLLPDNIQEQVRLVDRLGNELDTLQDGLKRFQQAGRTPPQQLTWGIDVLRSQLRAARAELKTLADEFQLKARIGFVNGGAIGTQLQGGRLLIPGIENIQLPGRDLNRLASGGGGPRLPSGLGSLLGLEREVSGVSRALSELREISTQVGRSLKEGIAQVAAGSSRFLGDTIRFAQAIKREDPSAKLRDVVGIALAAASGMTVLDGAFSVLGPAIEALVSPLKIFGEIIGIGLTPILRLLFPILKALAIVLSYVQEAFDRVIGVLLKGIGWFVRAIGKVINFLDPFGNPGNGLVKLGNSLRSSADSFFDAADEIKKKRKELQGLSFDDALGKTTDSLNRLTESVLNAVQGFKIAKYRFEATAPHATNFSVPTETMRGNMVQAAPQWAPSIGQVHIHAAPGEDVHEFWQRLKAVIRQEARHTPSMQTFAAQLG